MLSFFLIFTITVINIVLWVIFFIRFKNLFSTDDIILKTREELNNLIADVNRNASLNITLLDDKIQQLKKISAEADRHAALLEHSFKQYQAGIGFKDELYSAELSLSGKTVHKSASKSASQKKGRESSVSPSGAYELTGHYPSEGRRSKKTAPSVQAGLFETLGQTPVTVLEDGSSYGQIPVITPEVYVSENPVIQKKDFKDQVVQLYNFGKTVDEIAAQLSRSTTEVQFVLDMVDI